MNTSRIPPIGVFIGPHGVFHRRLGEAATKIGRRITVKALISAAGDSTTLVALKFEACNGQVNELKLPRADFLKFSTFKPALENGGYEFPDNPSLTSQLHQVLTKRQPDQQWQLVDKVGWHGEKFVLPGRPAKTDSQLLVYEPEDPEYADQYKCKGTTEAWKSSVAALAVHSSRLVLGTCLAFAAPLLRFSVVESGGFHLYGDSSKGKTTCLLVAKSVTGPAIRKQLFNWDHTLTGLEEVAAAHNDCLLCLDEVSHMDADAAGTARKIRQTTFKLAGGRGKKRSIIYGRKQRVNALSWRLLYISNGEKAMFELASEAAVRRLKGEQVRLIDIPADENRPLGIYETLPPSCPDPGTLSDQLEGACQHNYGTPFRDFIEKLVVTDKGKIEVYLRQRMDHFLSKAGAPANGWDRRFAVRFALAFAAGSLAAKFGILPWSPNTIGTAIKACYQDACARIPDTPDLLADGLRRLRQQLSNGANILDLARSGHNISWTPKKAQSAQGFRSADGTHYLVSPGEFERWFESRLQADVVLKELDRGGWRMKSGDGHPTIQVQIRGVEGRRRYYGIRASILRTS